MGWFTGALLTCVIANNNTNREAGFTRNLWLFTTFFTMSAGVWMELLAKPGALARAQSGLASVPRPLRAIRRKSERLGRYVQITRIAVRHGFGRSLGIEAGTDGVVEDGKAPVAVRLRRTLE